MNIKHWTKEEVDYLEQNYGMIPAADIAAHLGRTVAAVGNKVSAQMIRSKHQLGTKPRKYDRDELPLMIGEGLDCKQMADRWGCHVNYIRQLSLNLSDELRQQLKANWRKS